ncbi:MAG: Crp/Fnr family transcriptional regulator [Pseudomonadota bacterium]
MYDFLRELGEEGRAILDNAMVTSTHRRHEVVIGQEEQSQDVFFVLEGYAQVNLYSVDGKEVAFRSIQAGQVFGELAAIDGRPRSASVVATSEPLVVGRLKMARFREMVEANPDVMWRLLGHLSHQVREMTGRIYEFSTKPVRQRLVLELVRQARSAGIRGNGAKIRPAPTHLDIAARISCHREAVSREMSALRQKGILSKGGGALNIVDVEGLLAELPDEAD